jgi:hypothetical protein
VLFARWLFISIFSCSKFIILFRFSCLCLTVSIWLVADCVVLSCQTEIKFERATNLKSTTSPAIIYTKCYAAFLFNLSCFYIFIFSVIRGSVNYF